MVGRYIYGDAWTGEEPSTEIIQPLPEELNLLTPQAEQIRACLILWEHDKEFAKTVLVVNRSLLSAPSLTPEQWEAAKKIAVEKAEASQQAFRRYIDVCVRLASTFKAGHVLTATRPYDGGLETYRGREFWNTENIWSRFDCCRVDPANFFSSQFIRGEGLWLFVEKDSLFAILRAASESTSSPPDDAKPEHAPAEEGAGVAASITQAGRPAKYDWLDLAGGAAMVLLTEERPASLRAFTARMLEWCQAEWGCEPAESVVRDKLKKIWDRLPPGLADNSKPE